MDLALKGKLAVVTGASRGIGKATALSLAREGCNLAICARGADKLEEAAGEIRAAGVDVVALPLDVTEQGVAEWFVSEAVDKFGRVDVLVNNVGGNRRKEFSETTDQDWDEIIELNLTAHTRFSRAVIIPMKEQGSGVILFISSIFGREAGGPTLSIYNTTKAAMISLAKIMALELAPHGIRVNSIAPGSILFPGGSWYRRQQEDPQKIAKFVEQNLPLGRFGKLEEIADVVTFLASERASLVTGACINIDGAQSRSLI